MWRGRMDGGGARREEWKMTREMLKLDGGERRRGEGAPTQIIVNVGEGETQETSTT